MSVRLVMLGAFSIGLMGCELEDSGGGATTSAPAQSIKVADNGCFVDSFGGTLIPILDGRGRPICTFTAR